MAIFLKKGNKYLSAGKVASLVPRLKLLMFLVLGRPSLQRIQGNRKLICLPRERHEELQISRATVNI